MMSNKKQILQHVLFWFLYWIFISFSAGLYDYDFVTVSLYNLSNLPLTILATYFVIYQLFPLYFNRSRFRFFVYSLLSVLAVLVLRRLTIQYIQFPLLYADSDWTFTFFNWNQIVGHLLHFCATIGIVSGIKFYQDWKRSKEKVEALSAEKREAELNFLKAQIHPHFLFNTLNSIYYEVVKKSDNAPDLIIRLSELLRFSLYECKDEFIPLSKEIQMIEDYIELEKSRYGKRLAVSFHCQGNQERKVPPLICFSLIENAFKHGASEAMDECRIEISCVVEKEKLVLTVKNPTGSRVQEDIFGASKGIGIANITRQLDLIFETKYSLKNELQGSSFVSSLEIPLR